MVTLGTENKWKGTGENRTYTRVEDKMVYIPVLETIQTLLEDETVISEVCKCTCIHAFIGGKTLYALFRYRVNAQAPMVCWSTIVMARCIRNTLFTSTTRMQSNSTSTMMMLKCVIQSGRSERYTNLVMCSILVNTL